MSLDSLVYYFIKWLLFYYFYCPCFKQFENDDIYNDFESTFNWQYITNGLYFTVIIITTSWFS